MLFLSMIKNKILATAILTLVAVVFSPSAQAQLDWGSVGAGGSGTWDSSTANWYNGSSAVAWDSARADFGGTAGTVAVSGTQSATGIDFVTGGYTISGGTINLTGTPTISGIAVINSTLQGTGGLTLISGSKTIGGNNLDLDGIINISGEGTRYSAARIAASNALGDSSAFDDRVIITAGTQGAALQLNAGVILPKYITNVGNATIETITGNTGLTGNFVPGTGTFIFALAANTQLTLSDSAGLGQSGSTIQATGSGRLVVDAAAGGTAYGLQIRDSAAAQVNSGATLGSANVFFDGGAGNTTLALNGSTVANNLFIGATTSAKVENLAADSSTFSGQLLNNGADYAVMLRSTTSGTLNVSGNINDQAKVANVAIGNGSFVNSGTVNLTRASGNDYDGTTTVNSGTLMVSNTSGSATGTGAVSVGSGAKLAGTGIIAGTLSVNGIVAAGDNSTGTLTVQNAVTWNGGASASAATDWQFNLGAANTSDLLNITGGSGNLLKGTGSVFRFDFQNSLNEGTFVLIDWAGTTDFSYTDFSFTNLGAGNTGTFAMNGSQLEFTATAVPEPSALSLLLGGALLLGIFKMRRQSPHPVI